MTKPNGYIRTVSGKPGSGEATVVFTNGAVSKDYRCGQFFMKMQDEGTSLTEARAYAKIGPMLSPSIDWNEINRILDTFAARNAAKGSPGDE